MVSFDQISSIKSLAQQGLNCWLQYVLAQPVYIDLQIMTILTLQFCGIPKLMSFFGKVALLHNGMLKMIKADELVFEKA